MFNRIKIPFILFFIVVAVIAVLRWNYQLKKDDHEAFINSTQLALDQVMNKMESDEIKVLAYLREHKEFNFQALSELSTNYPFYVYKSGQLVFWNDGIIVPQLDTDFENGWHFYNSEAGQFLLLSRKSDESNIVLLFSCPLFTNYAVNNDYVQPYYNEEIFTQDGFILKSSEPSGSQNIYEISSLNRESLFYIQLSENFNNHSKGLHLLIILFEVSGCLLLLLILWQICIFNLNVNAHFALAIFLIGIAAFRVLVWAINFPFLPEEVELFDPKYFASSILNPSFGALLINCLLLFLIAAFVLRYLNILWSKKRLNYNLYFSVFLSFLGFNAFLFIYGFIELIYRHSQWGLGIENTINPDLFKLLSAVTFLGFGLFTFYIIRWIHNWKILNISKPKRFLIDQFIGLGLFVIFAIIIKAPFVWVSIFVVFLNSLVYFLKLSQQFKRLSFIGFIYVFLIVAAISATAAWSTYHMENYLKQNEQATFANRLINNNDVLAEYLLTEMDASLKSDRQIKNQFLLPLTPYSLVVNKIEKYYLNEYFDKYEKLISIFDANGNALYGSNRTNFNNRNLADQLIDKNLRAGIKLYLINSPDESIAQKRYVYLYEIKLAQYILATIVIELSPKKIQPDNVFPELLVDKRFVPNVKEIPYAYAVYQNDSLDYKVGNLQFPEIIHWDGSDIKEEIKSESNVQYKPFLARNGDQTVLFANRSESFITLFSKFSFFFILSFTLVLLFSIYYLIKSFWGQQSIGLSAKIQLFFSLAFLIPLLSISISTISFVNATFLQDIVRAYQERISRVADHLTSDIMDFENGQMNKDQLNNELLNTTKMVNSDLNIFSLNGKLLVTSQPQIFEKNLLSNYIDQEAYANIKFQQRKLFTLEDHIGNLDYKTAYAAIYSYNTGDLIAILSSPFFKSSKEYDDLLANLLTNVFNIFVASFIVFIVLAYTATKILTEPLTLLKNKLSKVNLAEGNEPLKWPVDDEIGLLISEYNQMLLKLDKSKQALAKSEKESAWREMAQQVAHEIKNPLTPMKLSLQHLLMRLQAEGNSRPETAEKIKSILSQVDNLSDIATSFSAFAKMPIPENDRTNVSEILQKVVNLFNAEKGVIKLEMPKLEVYALIDHKMAERIFNNMFINAIQSAKREEELSIEVQLTTSESKVLISIRDNGAGIPEELRSKVFLPNFTTKDEGSGIGLAIAKRGVEYAGGKVWFESELGVGTNFFIELQKMD